MLLLARGALAAPTGLVVLGEPKVQARVWHELESWLVHHGHAVQKDPLDQDGVMTIANCLQMHDPACARAVVEKRAHTDDVVFAQVETTKERAITIEVYWIVKEHEAAAERRACEDCTDAALTGTIDELMKVLAGSGAANSGRVEIKSNPSGITVVLDNEVVGVTPIVRDVAAGSHAIVLMRGTQKVGERTITVHATESAEVTVPVHLPKPSRAPGAVILGTGLVAMATAGAMYALSPTDDGTQLHYRDYRPPALGIGIGGAALAVLGTILFIHEGHTESAPVASIGAHGGMIGWARAF